jgi:hypothetical protein
MVLRNVGILLQHSTVSQPRIPRLQSSSPWITKVSEFQLQTLKYMWRPIRNKTRTHAHCSHFSLHATGWWEAVHFYSGGTRFETRPDYWLSWHICAILWVSLSELWDSNVTGVPPTSLRIPAYAQSCYFRQRNNLSLSSNPRTTECTSSFRIRLNEHICILNFLSYTIATRYGLDNRGGVRFLATARNFSLHHRVQIGSGTHPASYPMGTRDSFRGGKAAGAWSWRLTSI